LAKEIMDHYMSAVASSDQVEVIAEPGADATAEGATPAEEMDKSA
jgi:hypothetical protein